MHGPPWAAKLFMKFNTSNLYSLTLLHRVQTLKKILTLNDGKNNAMSTEDAEKLIKYLLKTYDKNHDGRFDYAG